MVDLTNTFGNLRVIAQQLFRLIAVVKNNEKIGVLVPHYLMCYFNRRLTS